jgi:hypothetical protein
MRITFHIDAGDLSAFIKSNDSARDTMFNAGRGQVTVGRRKKLPGERIKAVHSMHIANIMRKNGRDPFRYTPAALQEVNGFLAEELGEAMFDAMMTGRPQNDRVKRTLVAAAIHLSESASDEIKAGRLGKNTRGVKGRKTRMVKAGKISGRYGTPPPYGINTGRFIESFGGGWVLGHRRR